MTPEAVIRIVGRSALDLDSSNRLLDVLEKNLFSTVIPAVDEGVLPTVVREALLQLYSDLRGGRDVHVAARQAFDPIRRDAAARVLCPIEAAIAELENATKNQPFDYFVAQHLASFPWGTLIASLPNEAAISANNFRLEIEAIVHEVEEGFVDRMAVYPEVARSAAIIASDLRMRFSDA